MMNQTWNLKNDKVTKKAWGGEVWAHQQGNDGLAVPSLKLQGR
jgi:hypothetical protein